MTDAQARPRTGADTVATLLHDLRTPLAIISGFAELLAKNDAGLSAEQRRDYVGRISAAAGEIRSLLDAERAQRRGL